MFNVQLLGGAYLGWSLGTNSGANIFGTAVASRTIRFTTAAILSAIFIPLGAWLEGEAGLRTLSALTTQNATSATYTALGAAISMTIMTGMKIPASTSQAIVGAIIGLGLLLGNVDLTGMPKILLCWFGTPTGAMVIAMALYRSLGSLLNRLQPTLLQQDIWLRTTLVIAGCYGAYALGANNVANVTAVYYAAGLLSTFEATLFGGMSIVFGIITYGKPMMQSLGRSIIRLDAFAATIVVLSEAIIVHIYAWVGVPVSSSQAVVGAVIGVGLVKQANAVRGAAIARIFAGWLATPLIAATITAMLYILTHLEYVGG